MLRDLEHRSAHGLVRVLLLARDGRPLWESVASEMDRGTADLAEPLILGELDSADTRTTAFEQAAAAFRSTMGWPDGAIEPPNDLAHPGFGTPLTLHMAALAAVHAHNERTSPPTRENLSVFLLLRERRYWERLCRAAMVEGRGEHVSVETVARTVFLATLFGPIPAVTGSAAIRRAGLAESEARAYSVLAFHRRFHPWENSSEVLWPLRPDRFGEDYIAQVLDGQDGDDAWRRAVDLASTAIGIYRKPDEATVVGIAAGRQFLNVLAAVCADDRHPQLRFRLFAVLASTPRLAHCISAPVLRFLIKTAPADVLATVQEELPFSTDTLREAAELANRLLEELPADAPLSVRAQRVARASDALQHMGDRLRALRRAEEAVNLYRRLTNTDPLGHLPMLADSLLHLGRVFHDVMNVRLALDAGEEAIGILRQLTGAEHVAPGTMLSDHLGSLAGALATVAGWIAEIGSSQAAFRACQEAVLAYRALNRVIPGAFSAPLAASLSNLGSSLSDLDRNDEAVAVCQEAVDILRLQAGPLPYLHLPNLAIMLNNLAARKAAIGDVRSALPLIEEGITIFRSLADEYPATYGYELARSLDNKKLRLEELGDSAAALEAARQSTAVVRSLADADTTYAATLAWYLHSLSMQAERARELPFAVITMHECAQIKRSLMKHDSNFRLNLGAALRDLGAMLWKSGDRQSAIAATSEAINLFNQDAVADSDMEGHSKLSVEAR